MLLLVALAYALAVTADCWTTAIALRRGLTEGNPIMAATGHPVLVSALVSTAYLLFAVWAGLVAAHPALGFAVWTLSILAAWRTFCAARNLRTIRKGRA